MSTESSTHGTLRQRWRYRLDNFLAKGSGALFISLLVAFLGAIAAIGLGRFLLSALAPEATHALTRQLWVVFLQLTDPGNMGEDSDNPAVLKTAAVVAGLTGVVIFSALIAFLTTALDQAIAHLKKGHSQVLESGHTLVLGWGPRVVEMLRELVEANASERNPVVVILSEEDKEEMDEYLRAHFTDRKNTRVVTRSGSTGSVQSLQRVSSHRAKSAIVLATCTHSATLEVKLASDARVIKTVLALESLISEDQEFAIVAEAFTDRNRQGVERVEVRPPPVPLPRWNPHRHPAEGRRDRDPASGGHRPRGRGRDRHHRRGRLLHRLPPGAGHDPQGARGLRPAGRAGDRASAHPRLELQGPNHHPRVRRLRSRGLGGRRGGQGRSRSSPSDGREPRRAGWCQGAAHRQGSFEERGSRVDESLLVQPRGHPAAKAPS